MMSASHARLVPASALSAALCWLLLAGSAPADLAAAPQVTVLQPPVSSPLLRSLKTTDIGDSAVLELRLSGDEPPRVRVVREGAQLELTAEGIGLAGRPETGTSNGLIRSVALDVLPDRLGFSATVSAAPGLMMTHRIGPGRIWVTVCRPVVASARGCPTAAFIVAESERREEARAREAALEEQRAEQARRAQQEKAEAEARERAEADAERRRAEAEAERQAREAVGGADAERTVVLDEVNLRAGPGFSYDVLASLPQGAGVEILSREAGWVSVRSERGLGWVPQRLVGGVAAGSTPEALGEGSGSPAAGSLGITNTRVSLRAEPTVQSERLSVLSSGREVALLEERGRWLRVRVAGIEGWIYGEYVDR